MSTEPSASSASDLVDRLQQAEEQVRRLQDELLESAEHDRPALIAALTEAVRDGIAMQEPEAAAALVPLAEVLSNMEGQDVADLLVDIASSTDEEVRNVACESLQNMGFERFKEVALAIERAPGRLHAESPALRDLPFVIAEIGEPGIAKILKDYLGHVDAEVVASAIEALAGAADPAGLEGLRKLVKDPRTVAVADEEDGNESIATIGELAQEAIQMIRDTMPEPAPPPRGGARQDPRGRGPRR